MVKEIEKPHRRFLIKVCGERRRRVLPRKVLTIEECYTEHKDKQCFREANGHTLCERCKKNAK